MNSRCEFFGIPNVVYPYENSSILVSYVDPNLLSKFIYEHWFRLPNSENVITIDLICEKNCKEMLPVLDHIVNLGKLDVKITGQNKAIKIFNKLSVSLAMQTQRNTARAFGNMKLVQELDQVIKNYKF